MTLYLTLELLGHLLLNFGIFLGFVYLLVDVLGFVYLHVDVLGFVHLLVDVLGFVVFIYGTNLLVVLVQLLAVVSSCRVESSPWRLFSR